MMVVRAEVALMMFEFFFRDCHCCTILYIQSIMTLTTHFTRDAKINVRVNKVKKKEENNNT